MPAGSRAPEITGDEIRAMAAAVNANFSPGEHLSKELRELLRPLEVTTCQGPFLVLTVMLAAMAGLNNGANIQLWSARPTPISAMALYAGDAQQGKSWLTAAVCAMIAAADDEIAGIVQQMPPPENVNPEEGYQQKFTVRSVGMQDFTPPEPFARCSREWPQIKEAPDLMNSMPHLKPRPWYSTTVNLDKAYSFLGKIGLTAGDVRGGHSRQGNCSVRTRILLEHAFGYRQNSARHENERMLWRLGHNSCQLDNRWKLALEDVARCGTGVWWAIMWRPLRSAACIARGLSRSDTRTCPRTSCWPRTSRGGHGRL